MVEPLALLPFVPSGKDLARSRELFQTLGFTELWENDGYVGFSHGAAKFILQEFDNPEFAGNLMMKIEVADVDAWWAEVEPLRLAERFPGVRIKPPSDFAWGREVHFIDLAGVCWHVGMP